MSGIIAVVQARTGSDRLPGKVLKDIEGRPMLARVVERAGATVGVDDVIVATTESAQDDAIAALAEHEGWRVFRGSEDDVLDRYYRAAIEFSAAHIVRVTADCPFYCPLQAARVVRRHVESGAAYTHNITIWGSGMPLGTGTEIFRFETLETSWQEGGEPHHREHVDEFVGENPERFATEVVHAPVELARPDLRLTVDEPDDLALARALYSRLGGDSLVALVDVIRTLDAEPELLELNRHVQQKPL